ncbi:methyltransferase domain-containing protein [Thermoleophilia bacterium SCSIO 60948]|nr:methyltransferase domain-containing protein [Thermoleophilia bacterium SCSIO 60948]
MRITGGEFAGRRLHAPGRGSPVRPTADRVREALFAILGPLDGLAVADLFCGTGALAIEALSRGAERAVMVDRDPSVARRNVAELGLETPRAEVLSSDLRRGTRWARGGPFDLILCDPPWPQAEDLITTLAPAIRAALRPGGRVVVESSARDPVSAPGLAVVDERRYSETLVRIHVLDEH